jgi:hypothetical protein
MLPLEFDYDFEEIVQMAGVGPLSLKSALKRMPDRIDARSILYRDLGKNPKASRAGLLKCVSATCCAVQCSNRTKIRFIVCSPCRNGAQR